jgi:D-sedoheptulose 7-phosphate isomerase
VVVGISSSGNAAIVIRAMQAAREVGCVTIGFTGQTGGKLKDAVGLCLCAPSTVTARIQEAHICIIHIICELVEQTLCQQEK